MTTGIIELNDAGVRVSDGRGSDYTESPGVAVVNRKNLLLGDSALRQSRLQPIETNSLFWHRLSDEPLTQRSSRYRHHADLAYSHLLDLHRAVPDCDEIVFAVPGSFSRQQMSLLLGIVNQCPFEAVGLVDSAVAAGASHASSTEVVHVDLQLHQCIYTLMRADGELERREVEVLPRCGLLTLRDRWAKAVADQFIEQWRFDPLHSATTEQSLYDQLPGWLRQFRDTGELSVEVAGKTIRLVREQLVRAVQPLYRDISEKANQLAGPDHQLLLGDRLAGLPGVFDAFDDRLSQPPEALPDTAVITGILDNLPMVKRSPGQVRFIQALPVAREVPEKPQDIASPQRPTEKRITHLLLGSTAYPLGDKALHVDLDKGHVTADSAPGNCQFSIRAHNEGAILVPRDGAVVQVNGYPAEDNRALRCGDTVSVRGNDQSVFVIEVRDRNGT